MSRAWVITLAVGILLFAAFGVVEERYWPGLATRAWWEIAIVLALGVYGACFTAVSIPRIVDAKLSIPVLAWIAMFVVFMIGAFGKVDRAIGHAPRSRFASSGGPTGTFRLFGAGSFSRSLDPVEVPL